MRSADGEQFLEETSDSGELPCAARALIDETIVRISKDFRVSGEGFGAMSSPYRPGPCDVIPRVADKEHLRRLKERAYAWNTWRRYRRREPN
jgi:hypothetical protein